MTKAERYTELREQIKTKQPVIHNDSSLLGVSYAEANLGAQNVPPIVFSPSEQVRYDENRRFGNVLTDELLWLVGQRDHLELEEVRKRGASIRHKLTPVQQEVFNKVLTRLEKTVAFCQNIDSSRLDEVVKALKDTGKGFLEKSAVTKTEVRPLGIIVSVVDGAIFAESHGGSIPVDSDDLKKIKDPVILEAVLHCVITYDRNIDNVGNAKGKEAVIRHELFHNLYKLTVAPEQASSYKDPVKHQLFSEAKDEIIAYLLQGIWEFHPSSLFLTLRRLRPGSSELDFMQELSNVVWRERPYNKHKTDNEREQAADIFIDEVWAVMRSIGFLRFAQGSCREGVSAILCAQSFKEIAFALGSMEQAFGRVSAQGVWEAFRQKSNPRMLAAEINKFLEEYRWLRLRQLDDPYALLDAVRAYIDDRMRRGEESDDTMSRLESSYQDLVKYFG